MDYRGRGEGKGGTGDRAGAGQGARAVRAARPGAVQTIFKRWRRGVPWGSTRAVSWLFGWGSRKAFWYPPPPYVANNRYRFCFLWFTRFIVS